MTIYLFGCNGMLGSYINTILSQHFKIVCFSRKDYDILHLFSFKTPIIYKPFYKFFVL